MNKLAATLATLTESLARRTPKINWTNKGSWGQTYNATYNDFSRVPYFKEVRDARYELGNARGLRDNLKAYLNWHKVNKKFIKAKAEAGTNFSRPTKDRNSIYISVNSDFRLPKSLVNRTEAKTFQDPEVKRLQATLVAKHELDEVDLRKRLVSPFAEKYHHVNPGVILREHNTLTTLPQNTSGKEAVLNLWKKIRTRRGGEIPAIFPNNDFAFGEAPRLSRHAIKRLTEDYIRRNGPQIPKAKV